MNQLPTPIHEADDPLQTTSNWATGSGIRYPWMETVGLTVVIPAFNIGFAIGDPFLIESGFPWLVAIPLLIGLRHGTSHALLSALTLIMSVSVGLHLDFIKLGDYPANVTIALLVLGLIGGEYRSFWHTRVAQVADREQYHKARLEQFSRIYHTLKQSHDRLEHQISGNVNSIRTALSDLHAQLMSLEPRPEEPFQGTAPSILKLMSDYGLVQIASLYEVRTHGTLAAEPAATLGKPLPARADDPLLQEALLSKQTVALSPDHETRGTALMAVIPIVDFSGRLWGVVTVNELPFVALQAQNLNLLSAFGGHIGDCLFRWSNITAHSRDAVCRFESDLRRAVIDAHRCDTPATVLALSTGPEWEQDGFLNKLMLGCRSLDRLLIGHNEEGGITLVKLMPGTGHMGAERFLKRLQKMAEVHLGTNLESEHLSFAITDVDRQSEYTDVLRELAPWLSPLRREDAHPLKRESCVEPGGVLC